MQSGEWGSGVDMFANSSAVGKESDSFGVVGSMDD
jgi:hypothetical protein